jgi:hypothetical protein
MHIITNRARRLRAVVCLKCGGIMGTHRFWCKG